LLDGAILGGMEMGRTKDLGGNRPVSTKERIRRRVAGYLWDYVGDCTGPGRPRFDRKRRLWIVPVLRTDGSRIGEVSLNEALDFVDVNL
jgi:hypothetical protein